VSADTAIEAHARGKDARGRGVRIARALEASKRALALVSLAAAFTSAEAQPAPATAHVAVLMGVRERPRMG
jgi:hypothetical protein